MAIMVDTPQLMSGERYRRAGSGVRTSTGLQASVAVAVLLLHLGMLTFLLLSSPPAQTPAAATLMVSLLAPAQEAPTPVITSAAPTPAAMTPALSAHARAEKVLAQASARPADTSRVLAAPATVSDAVVSGPAAPLASPSSSAGLPASVVAGVVVPPNVRAAYASNPKPVYPLVSRRLNEAGISRLRVLVAADGHVQDIELERSSGFTRLDKAAMAAVRDWKFAPARQGDATVAAWVLVPINWNLGS